MQYDTYKHFKVNRKVQGVSQAQTAAYPWHHEEEKNDTKKTKCKKKKKKKKAQQVHRPALSSLSEMIAMLKRIKIQGQNTRQYLI